MRLSENELLLLRGAILESMEYVGDECVREEERELLNKVTNEILRRRAKKVGA